MSQDIKTSRITPIFIALQYITALLVIIFFTTKWSAAEEFLKNFLFYALVFVLPVFLLIGIAYKDNPFVYLQLKPHVRAIAAGLVIGVAMAGIFFITNQFRIKDITFDIAQVLALAGGALAGLFEEIVFRGFYLKYIMDRIGFVWANIITSVLFTLLHIRQIIQQGMIQMVMLIIISLFLGYAYEKSKSLWVPIIIHITFNILIFLFR